jgi:peptidoglycan/xylan/chitin deacetylase (PgdA/CDA1 family)
MRPPGLRLLAPTAAALALAGCGATAAAPKPPAGHAAPAASQPSAPVTGRGAIARLLREGHPVYCGGHRPYAALTFDDGPGVYTRLALRALRAAHVPATFFLVGRNLARFSRLARADAEAGALGNHTWDHPVLTALPPAQIQSELARTSSGIRHYTGVTPRLFRPPYEARDATVDSVARRNGLLEILWNVDSRDSEGANYAEIARRVLAGVSPGAIVLMHENHGQTIRALKFYILPALARRKIKLVTVPQLLALDPPSRQGLAAGRAACQYHGASYRGG